MACLLQHSVFIHTPKTAGQWVAAALENAGLLEGSLGVVHSSPDEISYHPEFRKRGTVFTFVRHPLTWYQSMWSHRMDEQWGPINDPNWFTGRWIQEWAEFTKSCKAPSFREFLEKCADKYPDGFVSRLFATYTDGCTFVGRQEALVDDLIAVLTQAGEQFDRGKLVHTMPYNVRGGTPARKKQTVYTPALVELVMQVEAGAIERFGYEEVPSELIVITNTEHQ